MASIIKIGERWRAQVRHRGAKSISKTFRTKAEAANWARSVEENPPVPTAPTVARLIEKYRTAREESGREVSDQGNEHYMLLHLADGLGEIAASDLTTARLVEWCQKRKAAGAGPYTINMEVSKLGTVIRHTKSLMGLTLGDVVSDARPTLHHYGLIGGGGKRERRPTGDELQAIFGWFAARPQYGLPMEDIVRVCMLTALRRAEVFLIRWADLDEGKRLILVRDRKDPRRKAGNDQWIPVLGEAWDIIRRQPKTDARIFPFNKQTYSKYFKMACDELAIPDLHAHDLRHEAASALFEAGWDIPAVAAVTGHKDWRHLKRYTNLAPELLHDKVVPITKARKAG